MKIENLAETDVLVIGGGMAGLFAAIKAREKGVDVAIIDKGFVGKSLKGFLDFPTFCAFILVYWHTNEPPNI